jgi:hypothetical protein
VTNVESFAEQLMRTVRDRSIVASDHMLSKDMETMQKQRRRPLNVDEVKKVMLALVPNIVDQVLFELLHAADNNDIALAWRDDRGGIQQLNELGMGEMAGWFMGSPGWRNMFSSERFNDDSAGLRLEVDWEEPG